MDLYTLFVYCTVATYPRKFEDILEYTHISFLVVKYPQLYSKFTFCGQITKNILKFGN